MTRATISTGPARLQPPNAVGAGQASPYGRENWLDVDLDCCRVAQFLEGELLHVEGPHHERIAVGCRLENRTVFLVSFSRSKRILTSVTIPSSQSTSLPA